MPGGTAAKGRRTGQPAPKSAPAPAAPNRRPIALFGLLLVALAVLVLAWNLWPGRNAAVTAAPGDDLTPIERVASLYNDIYVYRQPDGNLVLSFGARRLRYIESIVDPNDELALPVTYTQSMTAGLAYASGLDDAAIIGLGGGRTAWYHHKSVPGLHMTAVELDPEVIRLAGQYFKVHPEAGFDIANEDGRVWLTHSDKRFDILLVDAYRGPFVPFHLLTTEFYKLIAEHLKPGGVVVQNVEPTTMLFDSAVATISRAFEHLVFLHGKANIVVLAYNGPEKDEATLARLAAERQATYKFRYDLGKVLEQRFTPQWKEGTAPLTDDFAPVEYLKAIERHNEKQTSE